MLSGQLRSAVIILIVTLNFSTARAQVERSYRTPACGILTERLSAKQLQLWRKIERIVFAADAEGHILPADQAYDERQREEIVRALGETKGLVGGAEGAAAGLGINRTTLLARMKKLGIDRREFSCLAM